MSEKTAGAAPDSTIEAVDFDSAFAKHFGGDDSGWGDGEGADATEGQPEAQTPDPQADTPETDPAGEENGDTLLDGEEGEGEGEDLDTPEEGAEPDPKAAPGQAKPEGQAEDESEEEFASRKEIEAIKDPEARKVAERAYKALQAVVTRKTQEAAERVKAVQAEAEAATLDARNFVEEMATPEGAQEFLHMLAERRPEEVFTPQVLVNIALQVPEVFEQAVEEFQRVTADEDAQALFRDKLEVARGKYAKASDQRFQQRQQAEARRRRLEETITSTAGKHGVRAADDLDLIRTRVERQIQANRQAGKKTTVQDVVAVVEAVAKRLRPAAPARPEEDPAAAEARRKAQERAKEEARAAAARRGTDPRGGRDPKPGQKVEATGNTGAERLESLVDRFFG